MIIIKVKEISSLNEKDLIEISEYKDFKLIHRNMFSSENIVFNLNGVLYSIGGEVAYLHKLKKNGDTNEKEVHKTT